MSLRARELALASAVMSAASSAAAGPPAPDQERLIREVIASTYGCDYASAYALCDSLDAWWPDDPAGPLYRAWVRAGEMSDWEDLRDEGALAADLHVAERRCEAWRKKDKRDAWAYYYLGQMYGTRAIFAARAGDMIGSVAAGLAAKEQFDEALSRDPGLKDAYLGLGAYHYWRSAKTAFLNWLPGVGDQREQGIGEHLLAIENGRFSRDPGRHALVFVYANEKRFAEAAAIADSLDAEYPGNRVFKWARATVAFEAGDWQRAVEAFLQVRAVLPTGGRDNGYNRVQVAYHLAEAYSRLGWYDDCLSECRTASGVSLEGAAKKRARGFLRRVGELAAIAMEKLGIG